jgi:YVTN family beta-propeller protein
MRRLALAGLALVALGQAPMLPTGHRLDPAGPVFDVGNLPLAIVSTPEAGRAALLLSGWREQGLQVIDTRTGAVRQTITQDGAFLGLAFTPDGKTLFASGGHEDAVYRYQFSAGQARAAGRIVLAPKPRDKDATRYPAGLALSPDGQRLYVAENVGDALAVVDLASGRVLQRARTGHYPYAVAVTPRGVVFVSEWGESHLSVFDPGAGGRLVPRSRVEVGRHPSALLLNPSGSRLFVASASTDTVTVLDTATAKVIARLSDAPPAGPAEGSTPNALALSPDGTRLLVAEADNDAVALFDLSPFVADSPAARGSDALTGRIPAGWYPTALLATPDQLLVVNGKGRGSRPNPGHVQPGTPRPPGSADYVLGQLGGTVMKLGWDALGALDGLTRRVASANGWDRPVSRPVYPPFAHVVFVIKENRTYDQVLGDMETGDGDVRLLFFPRPVTPNHHALAERFGLFDRFFTNAEVSSQGHVWTTAAYVTDYGEKTTPSAYSRRRADVDEGEVDEPATGFLWTAAIRKGVSLRVYGEFGKKAPGTPVRYTSTKKELVPHTSPTYPSYDLTITDQQRAEAWLADLEEFTRAGSMPALQILHLPNDHTSGALAGRPTPRAMVADNDLALGRIVEALSRSPFWKDTVLFSVEDDAQAGPDHVDSHRSVLLVVSAYNRGGTVHRFVNTTDVVATVEEILGLDPLSQFDRFGRPLREVFSETPDLTPYRATTPSVRLDERNPARGRAALDSLRLRLARPDSGQDALFNEVLWRAIKGDAPMPRARRLSTLELAHADR